MFKNYFITAWRNVTRQRGSALINLAGLTLGITCSLVLLLMVMNFKSYDTFQSKRDRIYRVVNKSQGNNGTEYQSGAPTVLPDAFRNDFPEVEAVVFTSYQSNSLVLIPQRSGELKKYQEERGVVYTEPSFFNIFDRKVLEGDARKSLDEPNEAVISQTLAKKYFNKTDVIGEIVRFNDIDYKIGAIIEDAPYNTDFPFDLMLSYATVEKEKEQQGWHSIWSDEQCYFLLKEGERIDAVEARLPAFSTKYLGADDFDKTMFHTQALADMHFDDRYETYSYQTVPKSLLIAFSVIALVLIVTACINFINLATAEAIKRSKEVGIRKSLGSSRTQLISQFLGETTLITVVAVGLSLAFAQLALGFLNPFLELQLTMNFRESAQLWLYLGGIIVFVSLLSGLYPAFVISRYNPVVVLKNQISNRNSSSFTLRRVLVVTQFFISQVLIVMTIVIVYQIDYSKKKDLGFTKEAIVFTSIPEEEEPAKDGGTQSKMRTLRDEIARMAGVESVSLCNAPPSSGSVNGTNFRIADKEGEFSTQVKYVDANYVDLFKLKMLDGRNVEDRDTAVGFIVNEKLAHVAGFQNAKDIVGKELVLSGRTAPVVGLVKDFHTVSLRRPIEATALFNRIRGYRTLAIKLDMKQAQEVIANVKQKWEASYPEHVFGYEFLDENIQRFYEGEQKMSTLLGIATGIAIFIGCLGLFGLATFMANQKTKEIGVRKVLGASVESIILMFSREYVMLIVFGFILSAPLAWFAMNAFLSEFAYKVELGPGVFVIGLLVTIVIALFTVGYKSFRAAVVNPVKSLRYE